MGVFDYTLVYLLIISIGAISTELVATVIVYATQQQPLEEQVMLTKLYVKTNMFLSQFKKDERGVTAIEYGLIAVAMAVLVTTAVSTGGFIEKLEGAFTAVGDAISTASS